MNDQRGLIKEILIIVIALIILGYFGFNITTILSSSVVQTNLAWFWNLLMTIWSWIVTPLTYLWHLFLTLLHAGVNSTQ